MEWSQIVIAVVGGGGVVGLAVRLQQIWREHRKGELQHEDTVIARWQKIVEEREEDLQATRAELAWYRHYYGLVWAAYVRLPPSEKEQFPSVPPPLDK